MDKTFQSSASPELFAKLAANMKSQDAPNFDKLAEAADWRAWFDQDTIHTNSRLQRVRKGKNSVDNQKYPNADGVSNDDDNLAILDAFDVMDKQADGNNAPLQLWKKFHENFWAGNKHYDDLERGSDRPHAFLPGMPPDRNNSFDELLANLAMENGQAAYHPFYHAEHGQPDRGNHKNWLRAIVAGDFNAREEALLMGRNYDVAGAEPKGVVNDQERAACHDIIKAFRINIDPSGTLNFMDKLEEFFRYANDYVYPET